MRLRQAKYIPYILYYGSSPLKGGWGDCISFQPHAWNLTGHTIEEGVFCYDLVGQFSTDVVGHLSVDKTIHFSD
jgi:hypothetical protein